MKRLLAVLLTLTMVLLLFAGCGSSAASAEVSEDTAQAASAEEPAAEEASAAEPEAAPAQDAGAGAESSAVEADSAVETPKVMTVEDYRSEEAKVYTMWMVLSKFVTEYVEDPQEELVLLQQVKDRLNVSFDFTLSNPDAVDTEFSLMIAAADYCDIIGEMNYYDLGIDDAIDQEIIRDIYDLVEENAPNYWNQLTSHVSNYMTMVTDSGRMGSLCIFLDDEGAVTEQRGYVTNGAWYDEFGLDIAETVDEFYEYLSLAYKNHGAQFSIAQYGVEGGVLCAWNVEPDMYVVDGQVHYGYVEDGMKEYLQMMNQWYSEGLIETEFYNGTTDTGAQLAGTANGTFSAWGGNAQVTTNVYKFDEEGHTSVVAGTPYLKMEKDGENHCLSSVSYILQTGANSWSFRYDLPDEDVITLLKVVDYMLTDEGQLLYNYGLEGQAFEYDENGDPQWTDLIINNPDMQYNVTSYIYASHTGTTYMPGIQKLTKAFYGFTDEQWQCLDAFSGAGDDEYTIPGSVVLDTDEMAAYQARATDVETYYEQKFVDWIIGDAVTDAEWDAYVEAMYGMGVQDMIDAYQSAYDRYSDRYAEAEATIG